MTMNEIKNAQLFSALLLTLRVVLGTFDYVMIIYH